MHSIAFLPCLPLLHARRTHQSVLHGRVSGRSRYHSGHARVSIPPPGGDRVLIGIGFPSLKSCRSFYSRYRADGHNIGPP